MNRNVILELSLLILICIHKSYIIYLEIYVLPIGHRFSFFGHGKVMENQCWKRGHLPVALSFCIFSNTITWLVQPVGLVDFTGWGDICKYMVRTVERFIRSVLSARLEFGFCRQLWLISPGLHYPSSRIRLPSKQWCILNRFRSSEQIKDTVAPAASF